MDTLVIVGAGLAGVTTALKVSDKVDDELNVVVVDRRTRFAPPALLPDRPSGVNLNFFLSEHGVDYIQGRVTSIEHEEKHVVLDDETVSYDYLVLATGKDRNVLENTIGFDHVEDWKRVMQSVDTALRDEHPSVTVVGGGIAGVELVAALDEYIKKAVNDTPVRRIDVALRLVERQSRVLPDLPQRVGERVADLLGLRGVDIVTDTQVESVSDSTVTCSSDTGFDASTVIWCGDKRVTMEFPVKTNDVGEVVVNPYMQSVSDAMIYAVGDVANFAGVQYAGPRVSAPGNVLDQARVVAHNIASLFDNGMERREYSFEKHPVWIDLQDTTLVWWYEYVFSNPVVHGVQALRKWRWQHRYSV